MSSQETAPYLRLKLRTCDDFNYKFEPTGKAPLQAEIVLAYSVEYAVLKPFSYITLDIAGFKRKFVVLTSEPVYQQERIGLVSITQLPSEQVPRPGEPTIDSVAKAWTGVASHSFDVEAKSKLARDIQQLADFLERRATTESLAYGVNGQPLN